MFCYGDKVTVKNDKYDDLPQRVLGYVVSYNPQYPTMAIKVMGIRNSKGKSGNFYFDIKNVRPYYDCEDVNSMYPMVMFTDTDVRRMHDFKKLVNMRFDANMFNEENNMNNKQLINGYRVAKVEFSDITTNVVNYAMYEDAWANEGEYVLCATASHGQVIGKVVKIEPVDTDSVVSKGREIICRIDYSMYNARQERLKRLAKLKDKMEQKRKELNDLAVYQALAANCPEMANMLKEFTELL